MPLALVPPPHANPAPTQVEYYFSEANLSGDQFMRDKIAADGGGFVKLSLINSFNRMRRMQLSVEQLAAVLATSSRLEIDPSRTRVRAAAAVETGGGEAAAQAQAALKRKKEELLRSI